MFSSITLDADLRASDLSVFIADIFPNDDKTVKKQTDARNREKMLQILNPCSIFFFFPAVGLPQISVMAPLRSLLKRC